MDQPRDTEGPATYRSYLLRLWRESPEGEPWRASLQSAISGERHGFADLDGLFDFIRCQTEATPDPKSGRSGEDTQERR
jgi:hypothetical protein